VTIGVADSPARAHALLPRPRPPPAHTVDPQHARRRRHRGVGQPLHRRGGPRAVLCGAALGRVLVQLHAGEHAAGVAPGGRGAVAGGPARRREPAAAGAASRYREVGTGAALAMGCRPLRCGEGPARSTAFPCTCMACPALGRATCDLACMHHDLPGARPQRSPFCAFCLVIPGSSFAPAI
jgi:hypothetical protein